MSRYLILLLSTIVLLTACTEEAPPAAEPTPEQTTATTPSPTGIKSGTASDETLNVDTSRLKPAAELDGLLNAGQTAGENQAKAANKSYYYDDYYYDDYYYYDYGSYYDSYYYAYESYDSFDYYHDDYYDDYDYFGDYYNYRDRSSYYVWSTYTWPSGYGTFTCYAQNWWGDIYYGFGYPASWAEDAALESCYADSYSCYSMGCW